MLKKKHISLRFGHKYLFLKAPQVTLNYTEVVESHGSVGTTLYLLNTLSPKDLRIDSAEFRHDCSIIKKILDQELTYNLILLRLPSFCHF